MLSSNQAKLFYFITAEKSEFHIIAALLRPINLKFSRQDWKHSGRFTLKIINTAQFTDAKWHVSLHITTISHLTKAHCLVISMSYCFRGRKLTCCMHTSSNPPNQYYIPVYQKANSQKTLAKSHYLAFCGTLKYFATAQYQKRKWHVLYLQYSLSIPKLIVTLLQA